MQIEISRVFDSWGIPGITYDNTSIVQQMLRPNINRNLRHLGYLLQYCLLYTYAVLC